MSPRFMMHAQCNVYCVHNITASELKQFSVLQSKVEHSIHPLVVCICMLEKLGGGGGWAWQGWGGARVPACSRHGAR